MNSPPEDFKRSYDITKQPATDLDHNIIIWDPLEKELATEKNLKLAIIKIITERYAPIVAIPFHFVDEDYTGKTHIRINFDSSKGSSSLLGTESLDIPETEDTINYAWFDVGCVLHEFGHALALDHEHQSPLATIDWNPDVVYPYFKKNYNWDKEDVDINVFKKYSPEEVNLSKKFDPDSIMLYFYSKILTRDGKGTKENKRLSLEDVLHLNKLYPRRDEFGKRIDESIQIAKWYTRTVLA